MEKIFKQMQECQREVENEKEKAEREELRFVPTHRRLEKWSLCSEYGNKWYAIQASIEQDVMYISDQFTNCKF